MVKSKDLECPGYTADGEGGRGLQVRFVIRTTGRMVVSEEDRPRDRESRSVHLGGGCLGDCGGDNGQGGTERVKRGVHEDR